MEKLIFSAARSFELWSYAVSHQQLLLRSNKTPGFPTRLEVLFKGVSMICTGTSFENLSIHEIDRHSPALPIDVSKLYSGDRLFRLDSDTFTGYVAAVAFFSSEDEKEYYDESSLIPTQHL